MTGTFARWGGILVRPRATVAALGPEVGRWDEWILIALFVLGSQIERVAEALASVAALGLGDGALIFASGLGRAVLPPILVSVLVDGLLGRAWGHARGLLLVPLVLVASAARLAEQQGLSLPGPAFAPELAGALWCAGMAVFLRASLPAARDGAAEPAQEQA